MADAQDLKSFDRKTSCGFESRHRHQNLMNADPHPEPTPCDRGHRINAFPSTARGLSMGAAPSVPFPISARRRAATRVTLSLWPRAIHEQAWCGVSAKVTRQKFVPPARKAGAFTILAFPSRYGR